MSRNRLFLGIAVLTAVAGLGSQFFPHDMEKREQKVQEVPQSAGLHDDRKGSILVLSWQNSFCERHPHKKECRSGRKWENRLVLHGLWPQPRSRVYCDVSRRDKANDRARRWRSLPGVKLPENLQKKLQRYMPGALSALERHEWVKHGSCYNSDPSVYFGDALSLAEEVDSSGVGRYIRSNIGRHISLARLRRVFEKDFGKGTGNKVAMECRRGILSEIRISLKSGGREIRDLLAGADPLVSRCRDAIVDAPGPYRKRF